MAGLKMPQFLLTVLLLVVFAVNVSAEAPGMMNYQGRLTDNAGEPVADVPHDITFRIYDETSTVLWEESHVITTTDGFFSVQLGSNGSPLTPDIFDHAECWLGITVGADPEITPRTRLNTMPYAFRTAHVQALDIANEAGVAAFSGPNYPMYLADSAYTVVCSLTISCPAEGYVMAVAHSRIATLPQHNAGTNSYATVGISDVPTSFPGNQDLDFQIDGAAPSGVYSFPFGLTSMFTVNSAGSYTYYYLGFEYSGQISLADIQFNLVYFPTAYGTVDPVPDPIPVASAIIDIGDASQPDAITEAEAFDAASLRRELADLKSRIEEVERQIKNSSSGE